MKRTKCSDEMCRAAQITSHTANTSSYSSSGDSKGLKLSLAAHGPLMEPHVETELQGPYTQLSPREGSHTPGQDPVLLLGNSCALRSCRLHTTRFSENSSVYRPGYSGDVVYNSSKNYWLRAVFPTGCTLDSPKELLKSQCPGSHTSKCGVGWGPEHRCF